MPTEEETRQLLAKAAATIEVDEAAPMKLTGLPEPHSRRWSVLAAAAGVVLAIGGGYLVAQQLGDDPAPAPGTDRTDREPVEREHTYADDELPSLLGYTQDEATELLESRGYVVETHVQHSCDQPPGYVLGSDPGPGTVMDAGDSVRVNVTGGPAANVRCAEPPDTWQQALNLARFARGLGPAPDFPDEISIAAGEGRWVELTADEAADPESWVLCDDRACHSALAGLEEMLTRPIESDGALAPYLVVTDDLPLNPAMDTFASCLTRDPFEQGLPYHAPTYVYVDNPIDGIRLCPTPPVLQIGWTENRHIASVRLRLDAPDEPSTEEGPNLVPSDDQVPGLIGYTQEEATELLEARGLTVLVHNEPDGCNVPGIVTGSTPTVGSTLLTGERVTIRVTSPQQVVDCVGEVPWSAIWDLVRYARGLEPAPQRVDVSGVPKDALDTLATLVTQSWAGASPRLAAEWAFDDGPCRDRAWDVRIWVQTQAGASSCSWTSLLVRTDDKGHVAEAQVESTAGGLFFSGPTPERQASADAFVAWARGDGPAPQFADRVRVMYGGGPAPGSTGWVDRPELRYLYSGCSGLGFPDCGLDPVAMIYRYQGQVVPTAGRSTCADGGEIPKRFAEAEQDVVRLEEPEPSSCRRAWAVELWIDEDGVIYGVNQAGMEPN